MLVVRTITPDTEGQQVQEHIRRSLLREGRGLPAPAIDHLLARLNGILWTMGGSDGRTMNVGVGGGAGGRGWRRKGEGGGEKFKIAMRTVEVRKRQLRHNEEELDRERKRS